jgi:putative membrane protein
MDIAISILVNAVAFFLAARFLRGVYVNGFVEAIIVAIVVAVLNIFLGTFLKIITLGILSIGVFTLLLDAILIQVADYFLKGLKVQNFWWALALALVVSVIDGVIRWVF